MPFVLVDRCVRKSKRRRKKERVNHLCWAIPFVYAVPMTTVPVPVNSNVPIVKSMNPVSALALIKIPNPTKAELLDCATMPESIIVFTDTEPVSGN